MVKTCSVVLLGDLKDNNPDKRQKILFRRNVTSGLMDKVDYDVGKIVFGLMMRALVGKHGRNGNFISRRNDVIVVRTTAYTCIGDPTVRCADIEPAIIGEIQQN